MTIFRHKIYTTEINVLISSEYKKIRDAVVSPQKKAGKYVHKEVVQFYLHFLLVVVVVVVVMKCPVIFSFTLDPYPR